VFFEEERNMRRIVLALTTLALTACSGGGGNSYSAEEAPEAQFGFMEAMEQPSIMPSLSAPPREILQSVATVDIEEPEAAQNLADEQIPQGMPQIAYRYDYGFRVDSDVLTPLQQQHADFCVSKGPNVCRIISMRQSESSGDYAYGRLEIEVVADQARDFGKEIANAAEGSGAELISSSITGEDLTKRIVDTEARLRARTLLRDRLMEVLRSRNGTVAELVEAERGVAQVNEEIDQARSWLSEMRGRVAFSDISIDYESGARSAGGFWEPISWAFGSAGATLGSAIAVLIMIFVSLLPWALVLAGIIWGWRKAGLPFWRRKQKPYASEAANMDSEAAETSG
jgi:hypothetical protein